jgi:hypothetical protein
MNTLNVQRVQLPDGRCLTIEGGSAADTARFITQQYLGAGGGGGLPNQSEEEPPLELPSMEAQLSRPSVYGQMVHPNVVINDDGEEPFEMPVMNFTPKREQKAQSAPRIESVAVGDEEPPMLPPSVF